MVRVKEVEVIPLSYGTDDQPPKRRFFAVLKVTTDEGIVGWGEASDCYGHNNPITVKALVEESLRWLLLDQDPLAVEKLIGRIRDRTYPFFGARGLVIEAISAMEIALWDIRGKVLGKPIAELLGAYRGQIQLYAGGKPAFDVPPDYHLEFFQPLLERDVKAVKVRIGNDFAWDERFVRSMRELLPADVQILVDGMYNYTPDSAIRMANVLGDIGVICFEEPVVDTNLDEIARVAAASPVPLAYGEHCFTVHDFRDLITRKAARILAPDATICGGISEARNIALLADVFGLPVMPHCGGLTAIGLAANLHAAAAMPNFALFEFDARTMQPLRDELPTEPVFSLGRIVDGCMPVPAGPGLGIDVDESIFRRYPYEIDERIARSFPIYGMPHI